MSEDNEYDNEWGTKKQKYYSMNKRENNSSESDSDFIENEKEAIRLQKLRAQKIKKTKILSEDEEEISEKKMEKGMGIGKEIEDEIKKNISFNTVEIDNKKILENISTLKFSLDEVQNMEDEIKILEENKKLKLNLPNTLEYLKLYKKINILNSANILFNIISTLNQKMTGHHPSIKNTAIINFLLNKNNDKNEEIQNNIEKILVDLDKKENEEIEGNEEGEEIEDDYFHDKDIEDEENEEEDDDDEEKLMDNKNEKDDKNDNKKSSNIPLLINSSSEKIKKPSFLAKKKRREKDIHTNKENSYNESSSLSEEDSFIKEQYKSFNKLNKEKELLNKKKEENDKKEIDKKNDFAIRKANKEVLKARGIYRKRKKYQGNAKLMNREKFYKKEKQRKKMVKEYQGKPDVYMGEATGIRRDLIRSTKIH